MVGSEPVIGVALAEEEEQGDLLPVADDVDDMFAIPDDDEEDDVDDQDGKDGEDGEDGEDDQSDDDADVEVGWQRKSVGLPSTLPQIA